jgi:hypothetical protein
VENLRDAQIRGLQDVFQERGVVAQQRAGVDYPLRRRGRVPLVLLLYPSLQAGNSVAKSTTDVLNGLFTVTRIVTGGGSPAPPAAGGVPGGVITARSRASAGDRGLRSRRAPLPGALVVTESATSLWPIKKQ